MDPSYVDANIGPIILVDYLTKYPVFKNEIVVFLQNIYSFIWQIPLSIARCDFQKKKNNIKVVFLKNICLFYVWKSVKYLHCTHKILKTREYFQNTNINVVFLNNILEKLLFVSLNIILGNSFDLYLFYIILVLLVHLHMGFYIILYTFFFLVKNIIVHL